jgi:hypothetical protein
MKQKTKVIKHICVEISTAQPKEIMYQLLALRITIQKQDGRGKAIATICHPLVSKRFPNFELQLRLFV